MTNIKVLPIALVVFGILNAAPGQTLLSDFESTMEGWSGSIASNTPFPNGFTDVTRVAEGDGWVLNLQDGGFEAGAIGTYASITPTEEVVTVVADLRIVTDPGNLAENMAFGIKIGSGTGLSQDFAYSKSRGSAGDDSSQSFLRVAASVFTGSNSPVDVVAAVTPDKFDWAVAGGTWVVQVDNVYKSVGGVVEGISTFDSSSANWAAINTSNSPFGSGFSTVSHVVDGSNGVMQVSDISFLGGAVGVYPNAIATPGVHTVVADVRIVTDPGVLVQARLAAAPGVTTDAADLSWSSSFATTSDDTGRAFSTVAVPVETTGEDDLAVYLLPDLDANAGSGEYVMQLDNLRLITNQAAPVSLSGFSLE